MTRSRRLLAWCSTILLIGTTAALADVKVSSLFSDHMVLQRDAAIPIWGAADPGEEVTVTIAGQSARAKADGQGRWQVRLKPIEAAGPHTLAIAGGNTITINDVLVGEVWICSGQSNMAFQVQRALNPEQEVAAAEHPRIRLLSVQRKAADEPQPFEGKQWQVCSPQTVGEFSAVGYFFGRDLHKALDVPIGLIDSSVGGTPAEAWTPRPVLESDAEFKPIFERWDARFAAAKAAQEKAKTEKPEGDGQTAAAPGSRANRPQPSLADLRKSSQRPAVLYNGMIHPLVPFAIRGAIWYQGESNAPRAYQYRKLFPTMIRSWREVWKQGEFPFLFVQLASNQARQSKPYESDWAELREAQTMTLALLATGMAVTTDVGDPKDIHPKNKQEVGRRLALAARALVYGEKIPYSGPLYDSMQIEDGKIRVKLKHTDGGLKSRDGDALKGFAVAGEDRTFVEAEAVIDGDAVVVHSEKVPKAVAVRYAWADVPDDNLVNGAGLPACPFRTDDWPGLTANEK